MKFSIKDFSSKCDQNSHFLADLVAFTEEILNGKLHFFFFAVDAVYSFVNIIINENKYCSDVMNKYYNKEFVMTKKDNKDFADSTKC